MLETRLIPLPLSSKDTCSMCHEPTSYDAARLMRSCKSCSAYWSDFLTHFSSHGFWDAEVPRCAETYAPTPERDEHWHCVLGDGHLNGFHLDQHGTTW